MTGAAGNPGKVNSWRRAVRAVRAGGAVAVMVVLVAIWLPMPRAWPLARLMTRLVWRCLIAGFRLDIHVHGTPPREGGVLHVANHVSWADIVVLAQVLGNGFVAKSDVAAWPLIGPAARNFGCVFIARDRRDTVAGQASEIAARFAAGESLVLFAEGTTGDGGTVLPFKSSLFAA
ncbi:MAG: 1-acyl-sn-glycerol-3-phosphate acyltransferase, partial [Sphingomonadales bacterium]|nr:1-acyl-sn-glycerol-3-phosphate acyltransferase [Sphingomonadales bacterium]